MQVTDYVLIRELTTRMNTAVKEPNFVIKVPSLKDVQEALDKELPVIVRLVTAVRVSPELGAVSDPVESAGENEKHFVVTLTIEDVELTTIKQVTKYRDGGYRFVGSRLVTPARWQHDLMIVNDVYADYTVKIPAAGEGLYEKKTWG